MSRSGLEGQLEVAAQEFVRKILTILRSASLADVAGVGVGGAPAPSAENQADRSPRFSAPRGPGRRPAGRPANAARAEAPADLIPNLLALLGDAPNPMPARALSDQLGVSLDALAKPLKQLRDEGKIVKQGEKRASKYALA